MRTLHGSAPHIQRRTNKLLDTESTEPDCGADDVDDSVSRADLVKVNLLQRNVVNLGLGCAQRQKDLAGQLLGALMKRRRGDDGKDVGEMTAVGMGMSVVMRMGMIAFVRGRMLMNVRVQIRVRRLATATDHWPLSPSPSRP